MFNWDGITEFVAVAETSSFTAAAKQLNISTAQVSRQISLLESRLATKLFYRTTRKVTITDAGSVYYEHCRRILDGLEEAERAVTEYQSTLRGRIRITAPYTFGESRIAPILNDFMLLYPELSIEVTYSNRKLDLIESGYDLAIRLGRLQSSSLKGLRLADRQLLVCAAPQYLAKQGTPQTLAELEQHSCIQGTIDSWRFINDQREIELKIKSRLQYNGGGSVTDAAIKGLGIIQIPDYYVKQALRDGQLVTLLDDFRPQSEGIWALYPNNQFIPMKVRTLIDYLKENINL